MHLFLLMGDLHLLEYRRWIVKVGKVVLGQGNNFIANLVKIILNRDCVRFFRQISINTRHFDTSIH